jgi:hypothetical protein
MQPRRNPTPATRGAALLNQGDPIMDLLGDSSTSHIEEAKDDDYEAAIEQCLQDQPFEDCPPTEQATVAQPGSREPSPVQENPSHDAAVQELLELRRFQKRV